MPLLRFFERDISFSTPSLDYEYIDRPEFMKRDVNINVNRFFAIFSDAVLLYEASCYEKSDFIKSTLAKASVLSVNFALEAAANSFLQLTDFNSKIKDQVDKFSTLDKFDFILQTQQQSQLPRGDREVQQISELIKVRNAEVHPKIRKIETTVKTENGDEKISYYHTDLKSQESQNPVTRINNDSDKYTEDDALKAVKILTDFLNRFIEDWLKIDVQKSALLLMPTWDGSIQANSVMYEKNSLEVILRNNEKIGIRFLGLYGILEQFP